MIRTTSFLTAGMLAISIFSAQGQSDVKAKVAGIASQLTKTPEFEVSGTKKKRNTPKEWLEVEVGFQVASRAIPGDFVPNVEVKFFVFPKSATDKSMRKVLTASVQHVNLLKEEELYSAVYLSPNTLARLFGAGKTVNTRDIAVAVEIHAGGKLVGGDATEKKTDRWWQSESLGKIDGFLRPKHKTPFAMLWSDRYAEVESQ